MTSRVKKRDGKLQSFDVRKIKRAIFLAYNEVDTDGPIHINVLVDSILERIETLNSDLIGIETIQDIVEDILDINNPDVADRYKRYRQKRMEARQERQKPDPTAIADYIHLSKYSRFMPDIYRRETFAETVKRVERMHIRKYKDFITRNPDLQGKIYAAFDFVQMKKVLPSMRSMQFAGLAIERHNARMYNCSFTLIDRLESFGQILYLLLCGCGVGFSVQWPHIDKLQRLNKIGKKVKHYTIEDSIEGWAKALDELIFSFINGHHIEFDYSSIRPEGAYLKSSGGSAPGHLPLKEALENVRQVLLTAQGRKLRPIECHDIICYSAEAVLAGGIRRSSLISLFSYEDTEMLYAKSLGNFNPVKELNSQRAMANNSAVLNRKKTTEEVFNRIIRIAEEGWGDPGFFFSNHIDFGCNPCGEIGLNPVIIEEGKGYTGFGFCNLCEINLAAIKNEKEFYEAAEHAAVIGTLQAGYTNFPFLGSVTEKIVKRDALLGVGLTGMMDNPELAFNQFILRKAADIVKHTNFTIAKEIGINPAIRCTTIKPGGTAPLELGGVACGIHPHHARRYFRRVTANPLEPAFLHFRKINPHMVEEKPNGDFCIIFPIEVSSTAKTVKEMSALEFMEKIFLVYENWIKSGTRPPGVLTHNVSATVTIDPEEKQEVIGVIWNNKQRIAAMSFAPKLLDKKFPFAPREEVTLADESRWNYLIENYRPVDWKNMNEEGIEILNADPECSGECKL